MPTRRRSLGLMTACLALLLGLAGVTYLLWSTRLGAEGELLNADFVAASTDDPAGSVDPGYDKDVADCTATVLSPDEVAVAVTNAYPSYACTFTTTIHNGGRLTERRGPLEIDAPPVLTITEVGDPDDFIMEPGEDEAETFRVHVEQPAEQGATYTFAIRKPFRVWVQGTIGFWRAWDRHNTFTKSEIEGWLVQINASSAWLGPTTVSGMEAMLDAALAKGATPKSRFLGHYLATRLNERSGILDASDTHNVTGKDPGNYLGLASPTSATLAQIIAAIETKYGTSPTKAQFNIMKDVCNALNNLDI